MSAATLDFEDVRVVEDTFELISADEVNEHHQQAPKMLVASQQQQNLMNSINAAGIEIVMNKSSSSSSSALTGVSLLNELFACNKGSNIIGRNLKFENNNKNQQQLQQPLQNRQRVAGAKNNNIINVDGNKRKHHASNSPAFKSNRRKSANGSRMSDMGRIAKDVCAQLGEPKTSLMKRACDTCGNDMVLNLASEVQNIENKGGMQTTDGTRRRTPGGVFWALFKQRVEAQVYDEVFAEEKEKAKERQRKRKSVQRAAKENDDDTNMMLDTSMSPPSTVEKAASAQENVDGENTPSWAAVAKTPAAAAATIKKTSTMNCEDLTEELPSYEEMVSDNETPNGGGGVAAFTTTTTGEKETMAMKLFKSTQKKTTAGVGGFLKPVGKEKQDALPTLDTNLAAAAAVTSSFAEKLDMVTPKASLSTKKAMNWADMDDDDFDMFADGSKESQDFLLNAPLKKAAPSTTAVANETEKPKWGGGSASFASVIASKN